MRAEEHKNPAPKARSALWWILAAAFLAALIAVAAGVVAVRSEWFRERVRAALIQQIETATGGRAEIGRFTFNWENLTATISPLTVHGLEPDSEAPLAKVQSVTVGLRIISVLERKVDLALLRVEQPRVHIIFFPDGSNNLPSPGRARKGSWARQLIDLAVRHYEVVDGLVEIDARKVPLNFAGQDLRLTMNYEPRGPQYSGSLASRRFRIAAAGMPAVEPDVSAVFTLDATRLNFMPLRISAGQSRAELSGALSDLQHPAGQFRTRAVVAMSDAVPIFSLPAARTGSASFDGGISVSFAGGFEYAISGRLTGRDLGFTRDRIKVEHAVLSADIQAMPAGVQLRNLSLSAASAKVNGAVELSRKGEFHFDGRFGNISVRQAASMFTGRPVPWDGMLSGSITTDSVLGKAQTKLRSVVTISPAAEQAAPPIEGLLHLDYDQAAGVLSFGSSRLSTAASSVALSGILGRNLEVRARTSNPDDLLPALTLWNGRAPASLPLQLRNGEATAVGTVLGPLEDPRFRGQISAANGVIEGHAFDRFSADVQASRESIAMQKIALSRGVARVSGDASLAANRGDFSTGALAAQLTIRNLPLADAEKEWNIPAALTGLVNTANVRLSGAPSAPQAEGMVEILKLTGMGQEIDRVRAAFRYSQRFITFTDGQADIGIGRALFSAEFQHPPDDYHDGDLKMDVTAQNVGASRIALLRNAEPRFDARLDGKTSLQARIRSGSWEIQSLDGDLSVRNIFFAKERLGEIALSARSKGEELSLAAKAQLRGTPIEGQGKWRLAGEIPGSAAIRFPRTSLTALRDLASIGSPKEIAPPPFQGFVEGGATVQVALRNPRGFQAQIRIDTVEFDPSPKQALRLGVQPQDIQIRNTRPVLVSLNINEARVQKTELVSRGTNLELEGTVPLSGAGGANFNINGAVNLAVLQLLNPDLLARGAATVNASVRGSLRDPMIRGRMEFRNASLYLSDFPNGVDSASGAIAFDRNRATIERLTAETGGGQIAFRGFIEFGEPLIYRLQSEVRQVRVRYPDDVSFTANADLSLTGTSEASTLSGTVTLNRAALRAGADVSRLLAQAAKPAPAPPSPGDVLRGMRFDVRIESSPTFELETSLTRNVETEVDLRLRGTPLTPALLGTVSVTSGEIQVLGTRYTVNRGDIRFLNPVKIEPTVDLDLETRTRGITVNIKVAGQPDKLNVNYSSDPPLQSREIIALLAVGRDPTASAAGGQVLSNTSAFEATGILSEAVSQQLSSRLQRFFGSSRVKIDPLLTGVENLPAARLTLEQQVSRDVTLTYITNLNRTQEQIVRLQWDFSPEWSAIAVRDSNGLFGIDFQYRKRFK